MEMLIVIKVSRGLNHEAIFYRFLLFSNDRLLIFLILYFEAFLIV